MIHCEEFILRGWMPGDEESLAKHANNIKIADKQLGEFPFPYVLEHAQQWIKINSSADRQKTFFAIVMNSEVVGGIDFKFRRNPHHKTVVLGYWLGEEYWNKGITTKAVQKIIPYIFDNFDVERIEARVLEYNKPSIRVLEKSGFALEGCMKNSVCAENGMVSELLFSKIRK